MKIVVQRVKRAKVEVAGKTVGKIGKGLMLLVGIENRVEDLPVGKAGQESRRVEIIAGKILKLRIFADKKNKMNLSVQDVKGEILVVSQFTLLADITQGNRPFFGNAAPPEIAKPIFDQLVEELKKTGLKVETGVFGAKMEVSLINDGPITIIL